MINLLGFADILSIEQGTARSTTEIAMTPQKTRIFLLYN